MTAVDPEEFLADLYKAKLGGSYTNLDRYREFREVFLSTEAGRRVLFQVLSWGRIYTNDFDPQPTVHAFQAGERNLALRIFATLNTVPVELPATQNMRRGQNG